MNSTKPKTLPLTKRGLNFEMMMWIFTRLSALAMYALILVAVVGALILGARSEMNMADLLRWGFMPNISPVQSTNGPDLTPFSSLFWHLVASALILVATAHGVHGRVVIADDYLVKPRARQIVRLLSILFMGSMIIIGLYVIWTT